MNETLDELLEDDGLILAIFSEAQELVQENENEKEMQALNMIVGSSFALFHAIQHYKEIKNGKSIKYRRRTQTSEIRS